MTKLTRTIAILAALGLTAPAFAQGSTSMAASGDVTASTSVDATTSTSVEATTSSSGSAEPASNAPSTTTSTDTSVNITTEQKTEIHQAITEVNVQPVVNVNFDINVGVVVPKTVTLTPLPARVVKILPHYKGFMFFLLPDGRIVIVDPTSLKIVFVIIA